MFRTLIKCRFVFYDGVQKSYETRRKGSIVVATVKSPGGRQWSEKSAKSDEKCNRQFHATISIIVWCEWSGLLAAKNCVYVGDFAWIQCSLSGKPPVSSRPRKKSTSCRCIFFSLHPNVYNLETLYRIRDGEESSVFTMNHTSVSPPPAPTTWRRPSHRGCVGVLSKQLLQCIWFLIRWCALWFMPLHQHSIHYVDHPSSWWVPDEAVGYRTSVFSGQEKKRVIYAIEQDSCWTT